MPLEIEGNLLYLFQYKFILLETCQVLDGALGVLPHLPIFLDEFAKFYNIYVFDS